MGIYMASVVARDWFEESEDGLGELASALDEELGRRGLPPYTSVPEETGLGRGSGLRFSEKLVPPMDGFAALCRAHLTREEEEILCGWSLLVPFALEEPIRLDVETSCTDEAVVVGAPQMLALAKRLAAVVRLPEEHIPTVCDDLQLTNWFLDGAAKDAAAVLAGPWGEDLDASFYVALHLRAAQHSLRHGAPITFS
jgi:hypothetical protein